MLSEENRKTLLKIASDSIRHGLDHGMPLPVDVDRFADELREKRACFVTLETRGNLRGCIGTLEPRVPLVKDVAQNAFQAAFHDPRFAPLADSEFKLLDIHISVLSVPELMKATSEKDLLNQMRPGIDGLVLEDGWHRGTFLPAVWEDLPKKEDFLLHLKMKAGLPTNYWSDTLKVYRYTAEYFP